MLVHFLAHISKDLGSSINPIYCTYLSFPIAHHKGTEAAHSSLFASGGECGSDQASEIQALHSWYR